MQDGLQRAVGVPLALAERVHLLWPYLKEMAAYGNIACKSDAQVTRKFSHYVLYRLNSWSSNVTRIFSMWSELKVLLLVPPASHSASTQIHSSSAGWWPERTFFLVGGSQSSGNGCFWCVLQCQHQSERHKRWLLQGNCEFAHTVCQGFVSVCIREREGGAWGQGGEKHGNNLS